MKQNSPRRARIAKRTWARCLVLPLLVGALGACETLGIGGGDDKKGTPTVGNRQPILSRIANEVKADPALTPQALLECLRWQTVYLTFPRFVTEDTEVGGTKLLKGMVVRVSPQAAHMDAEVYPDPLRFDLHRNPRVMAFGSGPHVCIGHHLAKLTMRIAVERLLRRFPDVRLADPDTPIEYGGGIGELRMLALPMLTA